MAEMTNVELFALSKQIRAKTKEVKELQNLISESKRQCDVTTDKDFRFIFKGSAFLLDVKLAQVNSELDSLFADFDARCPKSSSDDESESGYESVDDASSEHLPMSRPILIRQPIESTVNQRPGTPSLLGLSISENNN